MQFIRNLKFAQKLAIMMATLAIPAVALGVLASGAGAAADVFGIALAAGAAGLTLAAVVAWAIIATTGEDLRVAERAMARMAAGDFTQPVTVDRSD